MPTATILHLFMAGPAAVGDGIRICGFAFLVTVIHGTIDQPFYNQTFSEVTYRVNDIQGKAFILGDCD